MGMGAGLTRVIYTGFGSLLVLVANTYFTVPFQNAAMQAFGGITSNLQMQVYLLDALVIFFFFSIGFFATRGIRNEGRSRERHYQKSQGH